MGEFQTWGLKDGLLLHISQVQSGLACGCVCPNCKSTLIARKGRKNQHSFAHYIRAQSCGGGQETALHLMAKGIIAKTKKIYLPAEGKVLPGRVETVDIVKLEVRDYEGFIPDIIVCKQNEALNIEIRVSHAVDDEKRAKLKTAGLRTIEIDLHDMLDDFSEESVAEAILSEERSTWVYNPAIEKEERAKQARKILCDYLPCEGRDRWRGEKVFCPLHKKLVWTAGGSNCCSHACKYFDYEQYDDRSNRSKYDFGTILSVPCRYRVKNLSLEAVEDIKKLERINGNIISVDVLCRNVWEHWGGYSNNVLTHNFQPKANGEEGKTIYDLWDTNYKSITIENIETGERAFIPGYNGHMKKHGYSAGMMVLGRYVLNTGNRWQRLEQRVIWDTNRPVWKLVSAEQIGSREYTAAKDDFASTNGSDLKNRGQAINIRCQTNLFPSEGNNNQSKTNTYNDPYTRKDAGTIETDGHSETILTPSTHVAPTQNWSSSRVMAWARCKACNRVDNVCRFVEFEGEGILKYGLCIECKKKQATAEKAGKNDT